MSNLVPILLWAAILLPLICWRAWQDHLDELPFDEDYEHSMQRAIRAWDDVQ